jgi:acylglycerol lipase
MPESSFSLTELREAGTAGLAEVESLTADDGVPLRYRRYVPATPRAALIFYHGGGAHSGAGYQWLGTGLRSRYGVAVYMPDIRGHGASGGPRGDAPTPDQVWADISTLIRHVRAETPAVPIFLGGHSSGAGLTLNYASRPEHEPVGGYVFLSPQLGPQSGTDRPSLQAPFVRVDGESFAAYAVSAGTAHGHDYAVRFNYPEDVLAADPGLVAAITVTMSVSLTPVAPREQLASLDAPLGLWIGSEDELFEPDAVLAYAALAKPVRAGSEARVIPGAKHLSVLVEAHDTIGPWIARMAPQAGVAGRPRLQPRRTAPDA